MSGAPPAPPPWLEPTLLRGLSERVAAESRAGATPAVIARACRDRATALRPGWPMPWIEEAVAIALWVGGADGAN